MNCTKVLVSAALIALAPFASANNNGRDDLRGIYGERLGTPGSPTDTALGGNFNNPFSGPGSAKMVKSGVVEVTLNNTGTGWVETFYLGVPKTPLVPAPVLVLFHEYGGTPEKMLDNTSYFQEAMDRGWIVVAPLSAHQYNFGIEYAQKNTTKALKWVAKYLPVDLDRFYGVGFSMGGGAAASFAARHVNPRGLHFAAIVNHTGSTSLRDSYWSANEQSLFESPVMFGGGPDDFPFDYALSSTIDLDTFSGLIDQSNDMARNLTHIKVKNFNAMDDPLWYLRVQTSETHTQLANRGADSVYDESADDVHDWSTLEETDVLDFLEPLKFRPPIANQTTRTLADRNGRWFHFRVTQTRAGSFSPFRWGSFPALNRIVIDEVENISLLRMKATDLSVDTSLPIDIIFNAEDDGAVDLVLNGYSQAPADVQRNGTSSANWSYANGRVTLHEDSASGDYPKWTILP